MQRVMPRAEIRVSVSPGEVRVAALLGGRLHLAAIERPSHPDGVGDLHHARVLSISTAMSGAFLALGGGESGFLPENELPPPRRPIAKALTEGQPLLVRVSRSAQGGKGVRVTARLSEAEASAPQQGPPALLRRGDGAALRFAASFPDAKVITDGGAIAGALRARLPPERVSLCLAGAFDEELDAEFEALALPAVDLGGGARLLIHPTPALTAIDVDAGTAAGTRDSTAHARVNALATAELARQIRLRNLAGAILVDFAGLSPRQREVLVEPLHAALGDDPLQPKLLGLTRLGLMEIVRPRVHAPLHETLGLPPSSLTLGLAALRRAAREAAAVPGRPLGLHAAPEVVAMIEGLGDALTQYRTLAGRALTLHADAVLRPGQEWIGEEVS